MDTVLSTEILLDLVWNNSLYGLALTEPSGIVIRVNKAFENIFGLERDITGENITTIYPDSSKKAGEKLFNKILQNNNFPPLLESSLITLKGEEKFLETRYYFSSKNDQKTAILFLVQDITDRKIAEWEIHSVKEKVEESERLKASFLAKMSHEIRTPMNGIIGFSSMLLDSDLSDEKRKQFVDIITESSNQLLDLIDDLIDLSKIEAHQVEINNKEFYLNDLINDLYAYFSTTAVSKDIRFAVSPGLQMMESKIICDEIKLKQVLTNLLSNAFKFTHEGLIEFGYNLNGKEIHFFVKDTGIGIDSKYFKAIFERFRQADDTDTRQYGGTGIGLPISKSYVELLGGRIWVQSKIKEGSTFSFTLPYHSIQLNAGNEMFTSGPVMPNWNNKTILVAEDEEINFLYITEVLAGTNVNIVAARNGLEAVNIARDNDSIDLILMDIKMPELNGYEATKIIKQFKPTLPIIAQTAYAMAGDREMALSIGCDDYISKPVKKDKLLSVLLNYIKSDNS